MCERVCCDAVDFARLCYSWSNVARWMLLFSPQTYDENQTQNNLYWNDFIKKWASLCFGFLFYVSWPYQWSSSRRFHYFCFSLLISFSVLFLSTGVKAWRQFVDLKKAEAHFLWQTAGTQAGEMDSWQVSLQVKWGVWKLDWIGSEECSLCYLTDRGALSLTWTHHRYIEPLFTNPPSIRTVLKKDFLRR